MISFRYKTSTEKISALVQICGAEFLIGGESQDRITTRKIANGSQNQYSKIINVENNQLEAELPSNTIIELKIESFQLGKNTDKFLFTFFFKFFPVAPRNPRALKPVILEAIISNADSHSPLRIGVAPNSENDKGNLSVDHIKYY